MDALKEVLRRVGAAAEVKRYDSEGTREWLSVTMDGLPYLVCRKLLETLRICSHCQEEVYTDQAEDHMTECTLSRNLTGYSSESGNCM